MEAPFRIQARAGVRSLSWRGAGPGHLWGVHAPSATYPWAVPWEDPAPWGTYLGAVLRALVAKYRGADPARRVATSLWEVPGADL